MPGNKKPTNPFLLLIAILLCLGSAAVFTQSSGHSSLIQGETVELAASGDIHDQDPAPENNAAVAEQEDSSQDTDTVSETTVTPAATVTSTPSPVPTVWEASPEAASGVWTSNGSYWMFIVNGVPYTGWLNDTDGKRYFFNSEGLMHTGWLDYEGKKYYMDLDGIMQTGIITVVGKSYELLPDGSLKN